MRKIIFILFSSFFLLGISQCDSDNSKEAAVDDMIGALSQSCNLGPWTKAALNRSSQLTSVYQSLQDKISCKGNPSLTKAISSAAAIDMEIRALDLDSLQMDERELDEASNDLMIALSQPNLDPSSQSSLISYYSSARYQLSVARAKVDYIKNPSYSSRRIHGLSQVSAHMRDLLAANNSLTSCLSDNPAVALQVGASVAELAGAFATPVVGLGVYALSGIFKLGVDAVSKWPTAESIYQTRKTRMPTALSCGMESFARDYCKAKDALTLLTVANKNDKREILPFFYGVNLQDRYMPILYNWLDRVVNGADVIKDPEQADKINNYFSRIYYSQKARRKLEGIFNESERQINNAPDARKVDYIVSALKQIVLTFFECNYGRGEDEACTNSMYYGFKTSKEFFRIIANGRAPTTISPNDTLAGLIEQTRPNLKPTDLGLIKANIDVEYESRYSDLVRDFNEHVNVDISSLVRDATRKTNFNESPLNTIRRTLLFLDQYAYEQDTNAEKDRIIIEGLRGRLLAVYAELMKPDAVSDIPVEKPCPPGSDSNQRCYDLSPAAKVISVTKINFKLDNNNVFLPGLIQRLVSTDITTRYLNGNAPSEINDIYRLAGEDINLLLKRTGLTPAQVQFDISRGQSISTSNLIQFQSFFSSILPQIMKDLKELADANREPEAGSVRSPNRNVLSQLCILTLVTSMSWPKEVDINLCRGGKIISNEAQLTLEFEALEAKLKNLSFDDRVCAYEEFLRADRLANLSLQKPVNISR